MTTISGAAFCTFYHTQWPKGWYVEDMPCHIEDDYGHLLVADGDAIDLTACGYARWEGGPDGADLLGPGEDARTSLRLDAFYARVQARRTAPTILTIRGADETLAPIRTLALDAGIPVWSLTRPGEETILTLQAMTDALAPIRAAIADAGLPVWAHGHLTTHGRI